MSVAQRPRIGLVHALHASIAPIEAAFGELWPEAETVSLYDQSLYNDYNRAGEITPQLARRIESLLAFSSESGAEAILFTGSLFAEPVEAARNRLPVPVLTAYEAMIEEAFSGITRPKLAVLATAAGTADAMAVDIEEYAEARKLDYDLEARTVAGAIDAMLWGDREEHDELVLAAVAELGPCDVLMLAQFSMAGVASRIPHHADRRVLTSPGCAVAKLKRLLAWSGQ